jgi:hypothetical protein
MRDQKWADPVPGWLPLNKAVFAVCAAIKNGEIGKVPTFDEWSKARTELTADQFKEWKRRQSPEIRSVSFSQHKLTEMLKEKSGAIDAEIDPAAATFSFRAADGTLFGGSPWRLLEEEAQEASPRLIISDTEEVRRQKQFFGNIRAAAGLVWRQFMVREFNRVVSAGGVTLFGRLNAVSAPFERLSGDIWPLLEVADWTNGIAVGPAPDTTVFWSIHAYLSTAKTIKSGKKQGRPPNINWGIVEAEVFRLMDHHDEFSPDDPEWNAQARLEEAIREFINRQFGIDDVAESTIRHRIKSSLDNWRSAKAGK